MSLVPDLEMLSFVSKECFELSTLHDGIVVRRRFEDQAGAITSISFPSGSST